MEKNGSSMCAITAWQSMGRSGPWADQGHFFESGFSFLPGLVTRKRNRRLMRTTAGSVQAVKPASHLKGFGLDDAEWARRPYATASLGAWAQLKVEWPP